ncbi:MAG: hypothetical protein M5U35_03835 [Roseovarius sp.]|nr:hypothetical protein [Roseovarius sp.]
MAPPGPDPLDGTSGDDFIEGFGGNDTLNGFDGNDTLLGGSGDDLINPGDNDGSVGDSILAGTGNDTIDFSDIVHGWVGLNHDDLTGPIGVNINGVTNTGTIATASEGTDTLINVVNPLNAGWSTGGLSVRGTGGNDVFTVHTAAHQWAELIGQGGDDTFNISGDGSIRLGYHQSNGAVVADLGAGTIQQDGFTDTVNGAINEIRTGNGNDSLLGSGNDESFIVRGGDDTVDGGGGFDAIRYDRGGYDTGVTVDLAAGTATGTWQGSAFSDTLSNIEWVRGSNHDDSLTGDAGDNRLDGNGGNDTLMGGDGNDTLMGGSGDDLINPGDNDGTGDYILAGTGNDTIDFADIVNGWVGLDHWDLSQPITVNIDGVANTGTIDAGADGTNTLLDVANPLNSGWSTGGLQVNGTGGDDVFTINTAAQQWIELVGGPGDDTFNLSGDGLVRLSYHTSDGPVVADLAAGTIQQDGFTDTVQISHGVPAENGISENGGVWELRTGNGDDSILGSGSDESFIVRGGDDTVDGGGGVDTIRYDRGGYDSGVHVDLVLEGAIGTWNGDAFTDRLYNIENVRGSAFNDRIEGDANANHFEGNDGADWLQGRGGNDTLDGGAGKDTLVSESGNDVLTGGADADVFAFVIGGDSMTITDFEAGVDDLALVGLPRGFSAGDLLPFISQVGDDVVIAAGGQEIIFEDTQLAELSGGDVIFV